ncbi:MAG: sigma-54 dependent transcriptional regulator [Desulfobulbaceae bacterium]|nr:sigma-54 dependent transcriptional regulator [Desulfobulbaceae bacterium]
MKCKEKILIVDDTVDTVELLTKRLRADGYDTIAAYDGEEALQRVEESTPDIIILDIMMPKIDGYEVCRRLNQFANRKDFRILMLTAKSTIQDKIKGLDIGADSYLAKPFDYKELAAVVRSLLTRKKWYEDTLDEEIKGIQNASASPQEHHEQQPDRTPAPSDPSAPHQKISPQFIFHNIISKNERMQKIFSTLPSIAKSDSTVLIQGPSGSGKELIAQAIHTLSERKGAFVALNCAALPDTLLESELFGYKKGAFTGADKDRQGRFSLAQNGTIFLDEIGDISPALQLKLLRVLQEKEFEPLGGTTTIKADVRVVAATNRNLKEKVEDGSFRTDLYFRLNVIHITLPSLLERRDDLPLLIQHLIEKLCQSKKKKIDAVSSDVFHILMQYDFPGNIRELENILEHCFVMCQGPVIDVTCLPEELVKSISGDSHDAEEHIPEANPLSNAEAATIWAALHRFDGSRGKTADHLGIDKTTLWRKMKKYQIEFPVKKS